MLQLAIDHESQCRKRQKIYIQHTRIFNTCIDTRASVIHSRAFALSCTVSVDLYDKRRQQHTSCQCQYMSMCVPMYLCTCVPVYLCV